MKNNYLLIMKGFVFMGILGIISSCSKEQSTAATAVNTPKTLDKTTLTPKKWYSQGSSVVHDFKAGGVYASSGTWQWYGSSKTDTMEIVTQSGFQPVYWKFFWNTSTEMSAERIDQGVVINFRDSVW